MGRSKVGLQQGTRGAHLEVRAVEALGQLMKERQQHLGELLRLQEQAAPISCDIHILSPKHVLV